MNKKLFGEVKSLILFCISILIFLSLISYTPQDLKFLTLHSNFPPKNIISYVGSFLGFSLLYLMGKSSYLIPIIIFLKGLETIFIKIKLPQGLIRRFGLKVLFYIFFFIGLSTFLSLISNSKFSSFQAGGILGAEISEFLKFYFGKVGAFVVVLTFISLTLSCLFGLSIFLNISLFLTSLKQKLKQVFSKKYLKKDISLQIASPTKKSASDTKKVIIQKVKREKKTSAVATSNVVSASSKDSSSVSVSKEKTITSEFKLPSLELLKSPPPLSQRIIAEDLKKNASILKDTLEEFGVKVEIANIDRGPAVTLYELTPAPGIKIQKVVSLSDDIALALKAPSVRIVAPLPGKGTIGVEVPNSQTYIVYLREVLETPQYKKSSSPLTLGLGKDSSGAPVVADLCSMPHLLIAGTTGSGKTVCINSIILSILFKSSPEQVKFILIDPKFVELSVYEGISHLMAPVISDINRAAKILNWAVDEMERRYRMLAEEGVRNIEFYNSNSLRMPYIVIIIDELADLMANAKEQIESSIQRLAQLARAVGIHLVLATQRPSVDVITGVIKANLPARISFKVASKVDSRTILDFTGADRLLGRGDMLFLKPDIGKPIRCQGSFVSDEEISKVVSFLRSQRKTSYNEELLKILETPKTQFKKDPLYNKAVDIIMDAGQASVTILQRKLGLSYHRAARIIDRMEEEGIIGPFEGSRPRKVLMDKFTWEKMKQEGQPSHYTEDEQRSIQNI